MHCQLHKVSKNHNISLFFQFIDRGHKRVWMTKATNASTYCIFAFHDYHCNDEYNHSRLHNTDRFPLFGNPFNDRRKRM